MTPIPSENKPTKAVRWTIRKVHMPLKTKIAHASHARTFSDNIVVSCELDNGTIGFGEGLPREYVTGETIDTSIEMLQAVDWSVFSGSFDSMEEAVNRIDTFDLDRKPDDARQCVGNAARCALEIAWLDAMGRQFQIPLAQIPAMLQEFHPIWAERAFCYYSGVITSKSEFKEYYSGWKMKLYGFKSIKIKVGTEGQNDLERMDSFRRLFPRRKVSIRVDANEAWTPDEAIQRIAELEQFGVESVEQPSPDSDIDSYPKIVEESKIPIMLDESLCSFIDAQQAIEQKRCDLFNIRLSKCGGLLPSLRIALLAHENRLGYQLGCQVGESGILSAAGRAFACSVANIRFLEGSYDKHLVRERLTKKNLTFKYGGKAKRLNGPGLGVELDLEALDRITVDKWVIDV